MSAGTFTGSFPVSRIKQDSVGLEFSFIRALQEVDWHRELQRKTHTAKQPPTDGAARQFYNLMASECKRIRNHFIKLVWTIQPTLSLPSTHLLSNRLFCRLS